MAEKAIARTWRGRVFIGVSLDGYIPRPDSDIEWLTDPPSHIDHERVVSDRPALDWSAFIADIDHLVMGRGTYRRSSPSTPGPTPIYRLSSWARLWTPPLTNG